MLIQCVTGCGAKTLHEDGLCQSCRDKGRRRLSDDVAIDTAGRMFALREAGRTSSGHNGTIRGYERFRRGFGQGEMQ